jgi:hypothetical protein
MREVAGVFFYYGIALVAASVAFMLTKRQSLRVRVVATMIAFLVPAGLITWLIAAVAVSGDK